MKVTYNQIKEYHGDAARQNGYTSYYMVFDDNTFHYWDPTFQNLEAADRTKQGRVCEFISNSPIKLDNVFYNQENFDECYSFKLRLIDSTTTNEDINTHVPTWTPPQRPGSEDQDRHDYQIAPQQDLVTYHITVVPATQFQNHGFGIDTTFVTPEDELSSGNLIGKPWCGELLPLPPDKDGLDRVNKSSTQLYIEYTLIKIGGPLMHRNVIQELIMIMQVSYDYKSVNSNARSWNFWYPLPSKVKSRKNY